ncbi:TolC family protein [Pseudoalteromonas sp. PAB 2.2]|uniref:TolC family protein n=1 Tax=Pseudoalteromonas sp. PAB 2.2 TaxID=1841508 RepID=UPI00094F4B26|nr:TolC family protein [Pseudoalteromonas sp. PAB 2.2]
MHKPLDAIFKKGKLVSAMLLAGVLAGCAQSVDIQEQQVSLTQFVSDTQIGAQNEGASENNWWRRLDSAQLDNLVTDALAMNHDLKTSQLQLDAAIARLGAARADYYPQGSLSVIAERSSLDGAITRQSNAGVNVNWQLDLFGRITALVDAANAGALNQAEQLRALQVEVVSAVVQGYVSYQGNVQKQAIIEMQIEALEQSIDVLRARVEEGVANELDLNRTLAQLKQQQALIPELSYLQYRDLATLAVLTGRLASDITLIEESELLSRDFSVSFYKASEAMALRPDVTSALYQFSQAYSLSVAASKALLPDISLAGFAGVVSLTSNGLDDTVQQWQVTPKVEWSLLSYPALLAQRDAQQFLSEAAYSDYQSKVLKAISESELTLQRLVKQQQQLDFANQRFNYANKAFEQAHAMYEEGQIPYLELLDARQDVLIAQENAVDSTIASVQAKVSAYNVFNGRWSFELNNL